MATNIIGLDALKKHLATFKNISKIEVCEKESSKRAILIATKDNGDPVKALYDFFDLQAGNETFAFVPVYLKIYLRSDNATAPGHGRDYAGFTFALSNKNYMGNTSNNNFQSHQMFEVFAELGQLRAENSRLTNELDEAQDELDEYKDKEEKDKLNGTGEGGFMGMLKQVKEVFPGIGNFIGSLQGGSPAQLTGDNELDNIIAELKMIDPHFKIRMREYITTYKQQQNGSPGASNGNG